MFQKGRRRRELRKQAMLKETIKTCLTIGTIGGVGIVLYQILRNKEVSELTLRRWNFTEEDITSFRKKKSDYQVAKELNLNGDLDALSRLRFLYWFFNTYQKRNAT